MSYEAGDWTVPTLTVAPFDATTTATLEVEAPAGTKTTPAATPGSDRSSWSAPGYELTAPGEWIERWTVTGTGASKERRVLLVAPDPAAAPTGQRVYATTADYANALRAAPPTGARRALADASAAVDDMLLCAVYDVDDGGMPTLAEHILALRDATCAQAEDARANSAAQAGSFTLGRLSVTKAAPSTVAPERYRSPRAYRILQAAGLTGYGPQTG